MTNIELIAASLRRALRKEFPEHIIRYLIVTIVHEKSGVVSNLQLAFGAPQGTMSKAEWQRKAVIWRPCVDCAREWPFPEGHDEPNEFHCAPCYYAKWAALERQKCEE